MLQAIYGFDREPLECGNKNTMDPAEQELCRILQSPKKILEDLDVEGAVFYLDFIWMCVFFIGLRIVCYIVLWWRVKVH